jgi:PPP family 3-phenylpropionic acid transporter
MTAPAARRGALAAFAGVSFSYFAFAGLFGTYAPLWFQHLGFGVLAIGTLVALQSATRLVAPYAWAWIADHGGHRVRLLRVAIAGALLACAGLVFARDYAPVATVVVVLFVCTAGIVPLFEAALAQWVSRDGALDAGRYGRVRLWGSIGFIVAVSTSGFALQALGVTSFPGLAVAALALLLATAAGLPAPREAAVAHAAGGAALGVLRRPEVAWFFAATFLTVLAHQALYAFLSLYLAELGYAKGRIGLVWAVGVAVEVLWFWWQGRWFGRLSAHHWLLLAALVTALRFAVLAAFGARPLLLVLAQCTHAITFAAQHTACIAVINRHFDGPLRGRGQALYSLIGYGASGVLAGIAGGALVEWLGYAAVFWAASAGGLLAAGCCARAIVAERAGLRPA